MLNNDETVIIIQPEDYDAGNNNDNNSNKDNQPNTCGIRFMLRPNVVTKITIMQI